MLDRLTINTINHNLQVADFTMKVNPANHSRRVPFHLFYISIYLKKAL